MKALRRDSLLHLMLLPSVVILFIYHYIPIFGSSIAFLDYKTYLGIFQSDFVGMDNFTALFSTPGFGRSLYNTVFIALWKIATGIAVPVLFALLLNEVRLTVFKRTVQTVIYLPYFISWVLLAGIVVDILSPTSGIVNEFLQWLGLKPVFFLGDNQWFPTVLIGTNIWKEFGYGTIIYMAALAGVNPALYEAALIDGAGRWKQTIHVTLPCIAPTIVLLTVLGLGNILNAGFEQIFNLMNPITMRSGDIIDTLVYRLAFQNARFSIATAAGLFKSVISCILVIVSYKLAYRLTGYKVI
ncbi:MAG: protein lplB [Paenibacillaceae bacterium]|jgi:putative aldouronate transport system permease protein|nr:protein lplB [Paenibacillaceae bacterium]